MIPIINSGERDRIASEYFKNEKEKEKSKKEKDEEINLDLPDWPPVDFGD